MIRLTGKIRGRVHVAFGSFEFRVPQITPEDTSHPQFVSVGKGIRDFRYLARGFIRTEINRSADGHRAEVVGLLHGAEQNLIELVRQSQQFVVIDFDDKGNLVGILAGNAAEHAESRSHGIATAFHGQLNDVFGIEILRIRSERSAG